MNDQRIAILTDTGTNVPADFAATHDVRNVSLVVNYSDGSFRSGVDITTDEVINRFETEIPTTSLPSPSDIQAALEAARADGYERAVFVTISSGLSATNQTVELVASQMEGFPVTVVDTKSIGVAAGLVVMAATEMVEAGVPFDELGPRRLLHGARALLPAPRRPHQRGNVSPGQRAQHQARLLLRRSGQVRHGQEGPRLGEGAFRRAVVCPGAGQAL